MVNLGDIYSNKLIPEFDYYVMLVEVRKAHNGPGRPLMQVILRIAEAHGVYSGVKLSVNIHPTSNADCIYEAFRKSFEIGEDGKAGKRFARIRIKHTHYGITKYAKVIFQPQKRLDLAYAAKFEQMEKREEAVMAEDAKKKAEIAAKKQAEKEAYEARFGKRGRGRPRHGDGTGDEELLF